MLDDLITRTDLLTAYLLQLQPEDNQSMDQWILEIFFSWISGSEQNFNRFLDPTIFHLIEASSIFLAQIMDFASNTIQIDKCSRWF